MKMTTLYTTFPCTVFSVAVVLTDGVVTAVTLSTVTAVTTDSILTVMFALV